MASPLVRLFSFETDTRKIRIKDTAHTSLVASKSEWETMSLSLEILAQVEIPYEVEGVSAHRTPISFKAQ